MYECFITARYYHTRRAVWHAVLAGMVFLPIPAWWLHHLSEAACLA